VEVLVRIDLRDIMPGRKCIGLRVSWLEIVPKEMESAWEGTSIFWGTLIRNRLQRIETAWEEKC
jgi:hypothetical protein